MDNVEIEVKKKRGGVRAGAGRPALKKEEKRVNRTMKVFDSEWEIINKFASFLKNGYKEECADFVRHLETKNNIEK